MTDAAIIYRSHFEAIENLPESMRYEALKALVEYCFDDTVPEDGTSACVLMMAKPVLDKWKARREAGKKGGEAERTQPESKREANVKQTVSKPEPKEKVKDKVKDIKEKDIAEKESPAKAEPLMPAVQEIVKYLNEKAGTHYRHTSRETVDLVKARMNDHFTIDDFKRVIDVKCDEWMGTEQQKYLRPETLFKRSHFEGYLNQPVATPKVTKFNKGMMRRTGADKAENDDLVRQILARG